MLFKLDIGEVNGPPYLCCEYMKSRFMLCEHATNQGNGASWCYEVLLRNIYACFDSFWVLESNGIHY